MSDYFGFPLLALDPELRFIDGYVMTAADGSVVNTATATAGVLDVDGDFAVYPKGVDSITNPSTGKYRIHLEQPFPKMLCPIVSLIHATTIAGTLKVLAFNPTGAANAEGTPAQTVDILFEQSGSPASPGKGGFSILFILKNVKT